MKRAFLITAAALTGSGGLAATALGQEVDQRRIERQLRVADTPLNRYLPDPTLSLEERSVLDVGGNLSFQAVFLKDANQNSRRLLQPEASIYARGSIDGAHSAFFRATAAYRDYSPGDSFDGRGDRLAEPVPDRYWYEFDLRRAVESGAQQEMAGNFNIRVGRQFVDWGSGLALSETLYAAKPTFEFDRTLRLEGLAGITPDHTPDFDTSRESYDEKTRRTYFGARLVYRDPSANEYYVSYLYSGDNYNRTRSRPPIVFTDAQFDHTSHFISVGANLSLSDNVLMVGEGVLQLGTTFSDPLRGIQTRDSIGAGAGRLQTTYLFRDEMRSRMELEFLVGTGDDDRLSPTDTVGGNASGTTDHAFNSLGFANTGLAFAGGLGNLWSTRLGYSFEPFVDLGATSALQLGIDGFLFNKVSTRAPIDEQTNNHRFLGGELDVYVNYRITSDLALSARYGVFFPGAGIESSRRSRDFALVSVVFSF